MDLNFLKVDIIKNMQEAREIFKDGFDIPEQIIKSVGSIVKDVRKNGEQAAIKYTNIFDKVLFKNLKDAKLSSDEINEGFENIKSKNPELIKAVEKSYANIKQFHEEQLSHEPETW
ncbi:MAG: histidinol dehydrogenase, partial [Actinobacteria bacterium]|nr:histidinol dehydrogenase [Actinomycetota bacterium]